jgi:tetratricopeptide (TPR) repeat protein
MNVQKIATGVVVVWLLGGAILAPVFGSISPVNREAFLAHFEAGEAAFGQRRFDEAVTCFTKALAIQPDQVRPRFRLGQALQALGRTEESVAQFATILGKHPNHVTARVALAQGLIGLGRTAEAQQQLAWILQIQPEHAEARALMASLEGGTRATVAAAAPAAAAPGEDGREDVPAGFQPLPMRPGVVVDDEPASRKGTARSPAPSPAPAPAKDPAAPVPPPARAVSTWKVADFLQQTKGAYGVNLEYARFCLEKGELDKAADHLREAEEAALKIRDTRRFLESQIHRSLLNLYRLDVREFGQQLFKLKPLLSKETYASFLEVYNRAQNASSPRDVARLVGGVALGAEHYAVAARLFSDLLRQMPGDQFLARMLAEAQMGLRDYAGAEQTLVQIMRANPQSAEAAMNLAKFYLTARFDPAEAARYLDLADRLAAGDPRVEVMRALLLCVQGKLREGQAALRQGLERTQDPQIQILAGRVLAEFERVERQGGRVDVAALLALPGSRGNQAEDLKAIGEDFLKRGSYFMALRCFHEARDLAEIGRAYLALASHLFAAGDAETSALAAGFGLQALREELKRNPGCARANLYLALYHFERREHKQARERVEAGLQVQAEASTRRHLRALYNKVKG